MNTRDEVKARGPRTLIRGWAMAVVATVPAASLHGGVDGHSPSALTLLVATVLAAAICVPLVGKKFTRVRSGAAILASQALFHTFFSMTGTGHVTVTGATSGHSHHVGHTSIDIAVTGATVEVSSWMVAAHFAAALITVGLVWYGESLLRGVLSAFGAVVTNISTLAGVVRGNFAPPRLTSFPAVWHRTRPIAARVAQLVQGRAPPVCA